MIEHSTTTSNSAKVEPDESTMAVETSAVLPLSSECSERDESEGDWFHFAADDGDGLLAHQKQPPSTSMPMIDDCDEEESSNGRRLSSDSRDIFASSTSVVSNNDDTIVNSNHEEQAMQQFPSFPPQLHPAVSLGVRRVSSCYFSIASAESSSSLNNLSDSARFRNGSTSDMEDFLSVWRSQSGDAFQDEQTSRLDEDETSIFTSSSAWHPSDTILYHDILMTVFTYLDAPALTAFSETARRPNFEVFYFLQLQLQRSLLVDPPVVEPSHGSRSSSDDTLDDDDYFLAAIAGTSYLSRLATVDPRQAQDVVQQYLESNDTLQTMPLSHSLAYIRHAMRASSNRRNGFATMSSPQDQSARTLARAAAFAVTFAGAAALMSTGSADALHHHLDSFGSTELPNMLFGVGFVGSLMGAASQMQRSTNNDAHSTGANTMRESAQHMARTMQQVPTQMAKSVRQLTHHLQAANMELTSSPKESTMSFSRMMHSLSRMLPQHPALDQGSRVTARNGNGALLPSKRSKRQKHEQPKAESVLLTPNPYDHTVPSLVGDTLSPDKEDFKVSTDINESSIPPQQQLPADLSHSPPLRKNPSGCVGAYSRAVHRAADHVKDIVKHERSSQYSSLSDGEKLQRSSTLLDACSSDANLKLVKSMVTMIDVDGFYVASDGSETCALHTAALHGAVKILEFLCQDIDSADPSNDGGLCNVNATDANGWTALHFAAGANSVEAVRILARHGATLVVEANNGYTALSWAQRLSNDEVAEVLKKLVLEKADQPMRWIMPHQPLSMLAHQFFSLIPSPS